jgi:hypothetical protein
MLVDVRERGAQLDRIRGRIDRVVHKCQLSTSGSPHRPTPRARPAPPALRAHAVDEATRHGEIDEDRRNLVQDDQR